MAIVFPDPASFVKNKSKYLAKKYGGVWKYDGYISWECNDGKRRVYRCCAPGSMACDLDMPAEYWLYENDKPSIRVTWE